MTPECASDQCCELGEGPVWHPGERRLYWVDITRGRLFRYDPATEESECVYRGDVVSGLTMQRDGSLLLFMDGGRVGHWRDGEMETVAAVVDSDTRFNDVVADPAGRVFCGTMPSADAGGSLYRLDRDGSATEIESDVAIPNGMGFTRDRRQMYFTETEEHTVYRYDYDEATGTVTNRRPFLRTPGVPGAPDGLTVDAEGYLWSARWDGGFVVRYDPDGREVERVDVRADKPSSVAFGGAELDRLYVTSAGGDDRPAEGARAGALFRFDPGVSGVVEFRSDVSL